jgi:hypothetical protein
MCGEAGKSGVARNTACHRTPDAAAGTKRIGTPRQPFWSAVVSGIPRDTALGSKKTEPKLKKVSENMMRLPL